MGTKMHTNVTKKRIAAIMLSFLLLIGMTACGKQQDTSGGEVKKQNTVQQEEPSQDASDAKTEDGTNAGEEASASGPEGEMGDDAAENHGTTVVESNAGPDGKVKIKKKAEPMSKLSTLQLVQAMSSQPGWNLGDSLDVCAADRDGDGVINEAPADGVVDECLWGNVRTTKKLFKQLQKDGVGSVRIPVTWRDHMGEGPAYKIDKAWMDRVQEVVDYALDCDMYVILNVHHDGGGDPNFGAWIRDASHDKKAVMKRYKVVWKQIAKRFKNYSDALILESMNEVGFDDLAHDEAYKLLNSFNQTFVDVVRASGGNNAHRNLLIAGYWTDIEKTCMGGFKMPKDTYNKCIVSVHYYTPWQFCTTNQQRTWGTDAEIAEMDAKFSLLEKTFSKRKIPVIIGEFGTGLDNETEDRIRFCRELMKRSRKLGIPAFFWDNGGEFDRENLEWRTDGLMEAMVKACKNNQIKKSIPRL